MCEACTEKDQHIANLEEENRGLRKDIANGSAVIKMMSNGHKKAIAVIEKLEEENRKLTDAFFKIVNKK